MSDPKRTGLRPKAKQLLSSIVSRISKSEEESPTLNPLEPWTFLIGQSERAYHKCSPWKAPDSIPINFFSDEDTARFGSISWYLMRLSGAATNLKGSEATLTLEAGNELSLMSTQTGFDARRGRDELRRLLESLRMLRPEEDGPILYLSELQSRKSNIDIAFSTAPFKDLQELLESLPTEMKLKAALETSQSAKPAD